MKKIQFDSLVSFALTVLAFLTGAAGSVMMAAASDLPYAGVSESGSGAPTVDNNGNEVVHDLEGDGIATETFGRQNVEEMYMSDIDKAITKIRPMSTPVDQISRYAAASHTDSFECKYYSVGTRPLKTTVSSTLSATSSGTNSATLTVADPTIFSIDDTIRVVGVKGVTDYKGTAYATSLGSGNTRIPDLVLCVCGRDSSGNQPIVYAVNGGVNSDGQNTLIPEITAGTTLIRMGKACGELDVQTGRFNNVPKPDLQYCQNFMIQIEQSTFDKIAKKEVNWGFSDLEEDALFDMRLTQEASEIFGDMNKVAHLSKENMYQWFTKGIWWMAGKDLTVGHWDATASEAVVDFDDVVDLAQGAFVGAGTGNKKKIIIAGSNMVNAFSKIDTKSIRRTSGTVVKWNLEFTSINTGFGEFLLIHHELFDLMGMANEGLLLDPEYLSKRTHVNWQRNVLDLKSAGIRNTDAVVLQEVACLYLRYPNAHARLKLAASSGGTFTAAETTKSIQKGKSAVIGLNYGIGQVSVSAIGGANAATTTAKVSQDYSSVTISLASTATATSTSTVKLVDGTGAETTITVTATA